MKTTNYDVIVVGAGISGMSAAYLLKKQGYSVKVFEKEPNPGGKIATDKIGGYSFETGPTILPNSYSELIRLMRELGIDNKLKQIKAPLGIAKNGEIKHIHFHRMIPDLLFSRLLSIRSLISLRKLILPILKNKSKMGFSNLGNSANLDTISVIDFCKKQGITEEAYFYLLDPIIRLTYLHTAREASIVELLWVLKNLATNKIFYIEGGTSELTYALQTNLNISCENIVESVNQREKSVCVEVRQPDGTIEKFTSRQCILAVKPSALQNLLNDTLTYKQRDFLSSYKFGPIIYIGFGLKVPTKEKSYLIEISELDNQDLVGIALDHNRPGTAPNHSVVTAYFIDTWNLRMQGCSDEEIRESAIDAVASYIPEVRTDLEVCHIKRLGPSVTMSRVGNYKKLSNFCEDLKSNSPIQIAGDFFSLSSMNSAVSRSNDVVRNIANNLK